MLEYRTPEELERESPALRLLHVMILMAIRDNATILRFEPVADDLQIWYNAPADLPGSRRIWFMFLPAPRSAWPAIIQAIRSYGDDVRPLKYFENAANLPDGPCIEVGRLTYQIGEYASVWSILLDTRAVSTNLILAASDSTGTLPEMIADAEVFDPSDLDWSVMPV
jgi:hypothetical protein